MSQQVDSDFIIVDTNYEGDFKVTITLPDNHIIFCEILTSLNKRIRLNGFSLKKHSVTISPITAEAL